MEDFDATIKKLEEDVKKLKSLYDNAKELLREIRDGEVNPEDEADKFLRDHKHSELYKVKAENKELRDLILKNTRKI